MYGKSTFAEKLKIQNFVNPAGIVYIIYVRNIWICREIEYLEIYINSSGNYVYSVYGMSRFADKLKLKNSINSAGNCVH